MEDEGDPRAGAARREQLMQEDRERIADREKHEAKLTSIIDELREGKYFMDGEEVRLSFPDSGQLGSPWKKMDGSWREGMGRAVARCETTALVKPPADAQRAARYPKGDHFEKALLVAGYLVDVWPDYENSSGDADKVDYYIYEPVE